MSDPDIERIVEQVVNECSGKTVQTREEGYRLFARRAAELAVAKERERCAGLAEKTWARMDRRYKSPAWEASMNAAAAIRAGKEVGST